MVSVWRMLTPALALLLASCIGVAQRHMDAAPVESGEASAVIYVVHRGWHTDVGFPADEFSGRGDAFVDWISGANYLVFGFGDRHYVLARQHHLPALLAAIWPGPGVILSTALTSSPALAFGARNVVVIRVSRAQALAAQTFVLNSMAQAGMPPQPLGQGPYAGSAYFAAIPRYSALYTCNTWVADVLHAAGLPVRSAGVVFAYQLWSQARELAVLPVATSIALVD